MPLTAVMLDSREPANITAMRFGGAPTVVTTLQSGDLWATTDDGTLLVVERKTPNDLLASIKDNRLFGQVTAMRERSAWVYVVITGVLSHTLDGKVIANERTTGWDWDSVQGALLTVQELGAGVVMCRGDEWYEDAVLRLARRDHSKEKAIQPRTQGHILSGAEQILTSLPGIGLERAQRLLNYFDNAAHALAWLTWMGTFAEVEGIGDGTKRQVRRALGLSDDQWLTVFYEEAAEYAARIAAEKAAANERRGGEPATNGMVGVQAKAGVPEPEISEGSRAMDGETVSVPF